jgi:hypothetical protein
MKLITAALLSLLSVLVATTATAGEIERKLKKSADDKAAEHSELIAKACGMPKLRIDIEWKTFEAAKADEKAYRWAFESVRQLGSAVGDFCKDKDVGADNRKALAANVARIVLRHGTPGAKLEGKTIVGTSDTEYYLEWRHINAGIGKL